MKSAKKALNAVQFIEVKYNKKGWLKQFTIDLIDLFIEDLTVFLLEDSRIPEEDVLDNLSYKASTALEICNDKMTDFYVIQELYDAVND